MAIASPPSKTGTIFGGALLVTGTCIGAGMIGLPVKTAAIGFYPTAALFTGIWLLMTVSAFLMLEASFALKGETNLISMAKKALGPVGAGVAWVTYILFLLALMSAYTSGGTGLFTEILPTLAKMLSQHEMMLVFILISSSIIFAGARCVDYVNRFFMIGLAISYVLLLMVASKTERLEIQPSFHPEFMAAAVPLIVTSFGFHLLIPSLKSYFHENVKRLRWAIGLGSLAPLIVYLLWQYVIMTTLPIGGKDGLVSILNAVGNPAELLINRLNTVDPGIARVVTFFSFFALVSSFIGVGLGLFDFFADGFGIRKKGMVGKLKLTVLTFLPPAIFTWLVPDGFLLALGYAGIFAAILLIIYPALMVLVLRSKGKKANAEKPRFQVKLGKPVIWLVLLCGLLVIFCELSAQFK